MKLDETRRDVNYLLRAWGAFTDFLERFNLIPVVLVVSTYHYYNALALHDPIWVALPIAVFVDLLHYRTIRQASRTRHWAWMVAATFTTAVVFLLQFFFYSAEPDTGERALGVMQQITFAAIVPVGVLFMAVLNEVGVLDAATELEIRLAELASRVQEAGRKLTEARNEIKMLQDERDAVLSDGKLLKADRKTLQAERDRLLGDMQGMVSEMGKLKSQVKALQAAATAGQADAAALQSLNPAAQLLARMMSGELVITQAEIAARAGLSESQVSRMKRAIELLDN